MNALANVIVGWAALSIITGSFLSYQYTDLPGFDNNDEDSVSVRNGRTKNAIANILSGLVAQDLCKDRNSAIKMNVWKRFFPDSQVNWDTTSTTINTRSDLLLTSSSFRADGNTSDSNIKWKVLKSEFNWNVKQKSPTEYKIGRFAFKLNRILDLDISNGNIDWEYRKPLMLNWKIDGAYIEESNDNYDVQMDVKVPLWLDLDIQWNVVCN